MLVATGILYVVVLIICWIIFDSFWEAALLALIFTGIVLIGPSPAAFEIERKTGMDAVRVQEMLDKLDQNKKE